jgi:hypothetical protein
MINKTILLATLLMMLTGASLLAACKVAAPPSFDVVSIDLKATTISPGEKTSVSATVQNIGGTKGVYSAALYIDGTKKQTNDILLAPGATDSTSFTIQEDKPGSHKISVGDRSVTLTVKANLTPHPMDLRYDSGQATDFLALIKPNTGYVVDFVPPSDTFIINKVQIYGLIFGGRGFTIRDIEVQIWDKDKKVLNTTSFPGKKFPLITYISTNFDKLGDWVEVYIPDVQVAGKFYVHVYAGLDTGQGFRMGADQSVPNVHSDITTRDAAGVDNFSETWPYGISYWYGDKSRVNWMVRASGNAMLPAN